MSRRIARDSIDELKQYLEDYVRDWSTINVKGKFKCFNSAVHRRGDADPSAAIVPHSGNCSWTCFSCGCRGDIFKAIKYREGIEDFFEQILFAAKRFGVKLRYESEPELLGTKEKIKPKEYNYQDEEGNTVYKVVRKDYVEGGVWKKDFSMLSKVGSEWVSGLKCEKRFLYRLPQVLKAVEKGEIIFLVEGEKCVHQILSLGLVGTTSVGGARSWRAHSDEYVQFLKGAKVVVLPDNDESGRQYGEDAVKALKGVAASVVKLELPDLPLKGDIVDWVQLGGNREKLLKLLDKTDRQGPVFERELCYYKDGKDCPIKLSNFIIKPLSKIISEQESLIEAELITEDGEKLYRVLKSEDFNEVTSFKSAIGGFQFSYVGKAEELQHIKVLISKKQCSKKYGVTYTGFHKLKDSWCFVSEQGALKENLETSEEVVLLEDFKELDTEILKAQEITREELLTIASSLFSFNSLNIASTILGYTASLFLKGKLMAIGIKHNHLIIEGQSGSGKSSTLEAVIAPLLCIKDKALNASECSNFALNRASSSSNFVPLMIDEYKPYAMGKNRVYSISNIMRNSYDEHTTLKGVATLSKNREFNARTSVILSGEVGMQETSNIERSLKLIFSAANHNEERRKSMKVLKENSKLLNKLGRSLLKGGLSMSEKKLKELYHTIYENLSGKELANERIRNSITNCLLGIALLREVFQELEVDFEEASGVNMKEVIKSIKHTVITDLLDNGNSSKGIIEDSLETMNRMAVNKLLDKDFDYDAVMDSDGDYVLRLNYSAFYDRFVRFCREHNVAHEVLPLASFKKQLDKASYCKCFNKPTSFKERYGSQDKSKTFRAAVLMADELKKRNVDIDYMLDFHSYIGA